MSKHWQWANLFPSEFGQDGTTANSSAGEFQCSLTMMKTSLLQSKPTIGKFFRGSVLPNSILNYLVNLSQLAGMFPYIKDKTRLGIEKTWNIVGTFWRFEIRIN